ncbi:hypothetical protein M0812_00948 [Anaeramoeba flamelloides]|uniref:Uncharacterized protein n=1 Tax=Anaeramoeba flamelloides TaxID=1746091 RepID=A0AAV8A3W0_9EUKA|nr:hypothetical protein M0812_00948 [Anaeramoeba flamelloides]
MSKQKTTNIPIESKNFYCFGCKDKQEPATIYCSTYKRKTLRKQCSEEQNGINLLQNLNEKNAQLIQARKSNDCVQIIALGIELQKVQEMTKSKSASTNTLLLPQLSRIIYFNEHIVSLQQLDYSNPFDRKKTQILTPEQMIVNKPFQITIKIFDKNNIPMKFFGKIEITLTKIKENENENEKEKEKLTQNQLIINNFDSISNYQTVWNFECTLDEIGVYQIISKLNNIELPFSKITIFPNFYTSLSFNQLINSTHKPTNIPMGFADTHDGGAIYDPIRNFIFSIHGNDNMGKNLNCINLFDNSKSIFTLPFETHGTYPIYDNNNSIYFGNVSEVQKTKKFGVYNIATKQFSNLTNSPSIFNEFCRGIFQNGFIYQLGSNYGIMKFDTINNKWQNNIFKLDQKANLISDPLLSDIIYFFFKNGKIQEFSLSKNKITRSFISGGSYGLEANKNVEIAIDSEDKTNRFIFTCSNGIGKVLNLKTNKWNDLQWEKDTRGGYFLMFTQGGLLLGVNKKKYWEEIQIN